MMDKVLRLENYRLFNIRKQIIKEIAAQKKAFDKADERLKGLSARSRDEMEEYAYYRRKRNAISSAIEKLEEAYNSPYHTRLDLGLAQGGEYLTIYVGREALAFADEKLVYAESEAASPVRIGGKAYRILRRRQFEYKDQAIYKLYDSGTKIHVEDPNLLEALLASGGSDADLLSAENDAHRAIIEAPANADLLVQGEEDVLGQLLVSRVSNMMRDKKTEIVLLGGHGLDIRSSKRLARMTAAEYFAEKLKAFGFESPVQQDLPPQSAAPEGWEALCQRAYEDYTRRTAGELPDNILKACRSLTLRGMAQALQSLMDQHQADNALVAGAAYEVTDETLNDPDCVQKLLEAFPKHPAAARYERAQKKMSGLRASIQAEREVRDQREAAVGRLKDLADIISSSNISSCADIAQLAAIDNPSVKECVTREFGHEIALYQEACLKLGQIPFFQTRAKGEMAQLVQDINTRMVNDVKTRLGLLKSDAQELLRMLMDKTRQSDERVRKLKSDVEKAEADGREAGESLKDHARAYIKALRSQASEADTEKMRVLLERISDAETVYRDTYALVLKQYGVAESDRVERAARLQFGCEHFGCAPQKRHVFAAPDADLTKTEMLMIKRMETGGLSMFSQTIVNLPLEEALRYQLKADYERTKPIAAYLKEHFSYSTDAGMRGEAVRETGRDQAIEELTEIAGHFRGIKTAVCAASQTAAKALFKALGKPGNMAFCTAKEMDGQVYDIVYVFSERMKEDEFFRACLSARLELVIAV